MFHPRSNRPVCSRHTPTWPTRLVHDEPPLPLADIDAIGDARTALALFDSVAAMPRTHETIVILLGHDHRGSSIVNIDGTVDNDSVLHVADFVAELAHNAPGVGAVIIASYRPGGRDELADVDRWLTIDEQLGLVGVELVEWFVIGRSVSCPRSLLGDPSRWVA